MIVDQHLEEDMISTLPATLHPVLVRTQASVTITARQLVTAMDPPSPSHSWRVVKTFNLTKWKSSMKLPEGIAEFRVVA